MSVSRAVLWVLLAIAAAPVSACEVDATGLAFGAILLERRNDTTGIIKITCDETTSFEVGIGTPGAQRVMNGPDGAALDFMIFTDPTLTVEWGDGSTLGPRRSAQSDGRTSVELTAYGVVPAQPGLPAGAYTTSLVVTVIY